MTSRAKSELAWAVHLDYEAFLRMRSRVEHPLREPSRRLVVAIRDGAITATTTIDVIQECAQGYPRRRPRATVAAHARRYATLLSPLLAPASTERDLSAGLRLFERHEGLDVRRLRFAELGSRKLDALLA